MTSTSRGAEIQCGASRPEPNYRLPRQEGSVEIYLEEMKNGGVDFAGLVQERASGWNNSYISDCVRRFPKLFVGHGLIDARDPNNAGVLECEVKQNGLSGMRLSPIYHPPNRYPHDQWLNAPANYPLWKKAEEIGAVFNVFIAPAQLAQLEDMVRRYPKVKVVVGAGIASVGVRWKIAGPVGLSLATVV